MNFVRAVLTIAVCLIVGTPAIAEPAGAWLLKNVQISKPVISPNDCYPGKAAEFTDGAAFFSQGYADCTGEKRVQGGERANTSIKWTFSQPTSMLTPDLPLVAHFTIMRQSSAVPYYGGGTAVFYFRNQSAVGSVRLAGFLNDPNLARSVEQDIRLDRIPVGSDGDKLTMWVNASGESGIGDVFYDYEFRKAVPPVATHATDDQCGQYALSAMQQGGENERRRCGFTGPRWESIFLPHYEWCRAAATALDDLKRETSARAEGLAKCRPSAEAPIPTPTPAAPERRDTGARFSSLTGEVEVRHDDEPDVPKNWHFVKLNTVLYLNDHIRTGTDSQAIIGFADLSTYLQKEETEIVVTMPPDHESKLGLVIGNIMVNVKKMWKDGTMEVEMSQAVAGSRGTVFALNATAPDQNAAAVLEGAIEVTAKATGEKILVKQGQRVVVTPKGFKAVRAFDVDAELGAWSRGFEGKELQDIRRRVGEARGATAPTTPLPATPADSRQPYGYWGVSEGADGVKVGTIFPDYSPTEFAGAVFYCMPRSGVRVMIDSPGKLRAGTKAKVTIVADGASASYSGVAQDKVTEDGSAVVFETSFNDPIFEDLARAMSIGFSVNGSKAPLPTRNSQTAFRRFFETCQR